MAQQVIVQRVDDIDGGEAEENVRFSLDGTEYEIDLSGEHAAQMREELSLYTGNARRRRPAAGVQPARRQRGRRRSRPDLPEIRAYAQARGYPIKGFGAVPGRIVEEYDALKRLNAG